MYEVCFNDGFPHGLTVDRLLYKDGSGGGKVHEFGYGFTRLTLSLCVLWWVFFVVGVFCGEC